MRNIKMEILNIKSSYEPPSLVNKQNQLLRKLKGPENEIKHKRKIKKKNEIQVFIIKNYA